jgi:hypothetical protein
MTSHKNETPLSTVHGDAKGQYAKRFQRETPRHYGFRRCHVEQDSTGAKTRSKRVGPEQ